MDRFPRIRQLITLILSLGAAFMAGSCGKQETNESSSPSSLAAYRKQMSDLDRRLQAEKQKKNYRVGIFVAERTSRYPSGSLEHAPNDASNSGDAVYVGVTVREKRTKRYLPGSSVELTVGDRIHTLHETWGNVHHYGAGINRLPGDASSVTVAVGPPAYGRHAGMKGSYIEPVEVTFSVESSGKNGSLSFSGPGPKPLPDDVELGTGIQTAIEEAGTLRTAGPYRIGFIVEGAEPFWTWADGALKAQSGDSAKQNHFEIVLLDRKTNEPIPHADISLTFEGGNTNKTINLYPLLAEFYHYGTNASVPAGTTYTVTANVNPPSIYTFEKNRFTSETVTFEWSAPE